ncbi:hypothetical protein AYI68_g701 [Smittium mucronatum]|uniref:Peroxisomal membrane protein 11C n=1 Tax=Smittium mucronatum TaxID=133383 RepID=A0A1R0H7P0_9FUNG|nr:hypothetical protein AYI68_g701 [Smittium mucronatum]
MSDQSHGKSDQTESNNVNQAAVPLLPTPKSQNQNIIRNEKEAVPIKKIPASKGSEILLSKLIKFFTAHGGCDNAIMLIQYSSKILVWLLMRSPKRMGAAKRLAALSAILSDYRICGRVTDFFPLYISSIHTILKPPSSKLLQFTTTLQSISMMLFYPLERAYWLGLHEIVPMSMASVGRVGIASVRFWAIWVVLNFLRLGISYKDLMARRVEILGSRKLSAEAMQKELEEVDSQVTSWKCSLVNNLAYFPLTLHWSFPNEIVPDVAVGILGTIAGLASAINRWSS